MPVSRDSMKGGAEMLQHPSRSTGLAALIGTLFVALTLVLADDKPSTSSNRKNANTGKTSGVIVKVEPVEHGDQAGKRSWRVTVNTDVVWRDFVPRPGCRSVESRQNRDVDSRGQGEEIGGHRGTSRAIEGMLTTVNLDPRPRSRCVYRSSTDEISEGAATPEGASRAEDATDTSSKTRTAQTPARPGARRQALKARVLEPMELKPGLWIDVEFRARRA